MRNLVGAVSDYKDQGGNPGLLMTSSSTTNRKLRGFMISSDFFIIVTTEVNFFFPLCILQCSLGYFLCFYESSTFTIWKIVRRIAGLCLSSTLG